MTTTQHGTAIDAAVYRISDGVEEIAAKISEAGLRDLAEHHLVAIDAWSRGQVPAVADEIRRRADSGLRLAAYLQLGTDRQPAATT